MKAIFTLFGILLFFANSYSQQFESVGAGVIDFLLTNPKTANKTNATEAAALTVIGSLLNQTAQRKHEINVAQAGRNEIVINTNSGNHASIYLDTQGNVYLLFNGTIHPISAGLVNQAISETVKPTMVYNSTTVRNATLPDFNLSNLKTEYRFEKDSKVLVEQSDGVRIYQNLLKFMIKTTFTCNWVKDFDEQGIDFEDFQGIKRSFYEDEPMVFILGYTAPSDATWTLNVYEVLTGNRIYYKTGIAEKGGRIVTVERQQGLIPLGVYIYNFTVKSDDEEPISKLEKFEIIKNPSL